MLTLVIFFILPTVFTCFQTVSAQAAASGVTFSPTVIDFGKIPFPEEPTQLLTVTFSRPLFSPDHLPSLRLQGPNGPTPLLFTRTIEPEAITLVYRIKLPNNGEDGAFHYQLILAKEGARDTSVTAPGDVLDPGVPVQGEKIPGLSGGPDPIAFGPVRYGKGAVKEFHVGFLAGYFHSNTIFRDSPADPPKPASWSFTRSMENMTATSNSPYITAIKQSPVIWDGTGWRYWQIILSPKAPQKKLEATLTFQTGDGYFLTVPVTADLSGPGYPISPWEPSKLRKH